ncbi:recombination mediator RecR [Rothia sp. LK2588]|uniref:recombination mediator RecR n=1 Tax=Rothia sp. LK2588 TaxID=3114369 RepID=UPI0034D013A7
MYDAAVQNLIDELGRLPGVGPKSAQRIAFYILNADSMEMEKLTSAIATVKKTVSFCEVCGNVSETKLCAICRDDRRDPSALCVVEESKDVVAVERTRAFTGRYHVLGGAINPLAGMGPEQLRIRELVARLSDERINEIILAMDPNLEGEATATYISRLLVPLGIRVSRLASGLPVGGDLEYADEITLGRALEGRRVISEGNRGVESNPAEDFEEAVEADESARAAEQQRHEAQVAESKKRWTGSMFDDLDDSPDAGSGSGAEGSGVAGSGEAEQGTLNEPLIEQTLEAQAGVGSETESGSGEDAEAPAVETDAKADAETTVTGEPADEQLAEEVEAAGLTGESADDAADEPGDFSTDETLESERADETADEAADRERAERRASYEQRLEELRQTPLRTPKPDVPPIPGRRYVNPWT